MRTNFVPSFFHSRKELENSARMCMGSTLKPDPTCFTQPTPQNRDRPEDEPSPRQQIPTNKPALLPEEDTASQDQSSSCQESDPGLKPHKLLSFLTKDRTTSPLHKQRTSPTPPPLPSSPTIKDSRIHPNNFLPIRSTLKNLVQNKAAPQANRSYRKQQLSTAWPSQTKQPLLPSSSKFSKTLQDLPSPLKPLQKQNQILREQNHLLRNELNEIKKHLLFGAASKKEEIISNLRDTIKKEDGEIRELRVKQEILHKKNSTLQNLLGQKEEEVQCLVRQVGQMQQELQEYRLLNYEKMENLKERTVFIMKAYSELESKTNKQEFEWLAFKEHWIEQKSMYLDRIKFLEDYISRSQ